MVQKQLKVALIGNPNTGKTSIFNILTGLQQKVGNYPGITVEKKEGVCQLSEEISAKIIDLPGIYSLSPTSLDEEVSVKTLLGYEVNKSIDVVVVVSEVENLKRNLLLFTQIKDLKLPVILVVNMADRMEKAGISIDISMLQQRLDTKIVLVSTRTQTGISQLKQEIASCATLSVSPCMDVTQIHPQYFSEISEEMAHLNPYSVWHQFLLGMNSVEIPSKLKKSSAEIKAMKRRETILRYQFINQALKETYEKNPLKGKGLRATLDRILVHRFWGYVIFAFLMMLIFQAVFSWSSIPMELIDKGFGYLAELLSEKLPSGVFTSLLVEGIVPGVGGVMVFVPQIAFLLLFMSILEETGYMSRVVFLSDRLMRPFGLSGKSIVPLISGAACAIPAIMVSRNISSWKERLITILVTPLVTCSARLPVYLIITELVIPDGFFLIFSYKTWVLFGLYALGFLTAVASAWLLDTLLKGSFKKAVFVLEMPNYEIPLFRNVVFHVYEKTRSFVFGAGKIILSISVLLWFLGSHGMGEKYENAELYAKEMAQRYQWSKQQETHFLEAYKLENSYLGVIGKTVEPVFKPLGYDWKISIGILASFAAREVFVGTLASIYSLGSDLDWEGNDEGRRTLIDKMKQEKRADGTPVFSLGVGVSLLLFYAFAMQCLSTFAIVRKETNSWKWAFIQWISMTSLAYACAFVAFQWI